MCSSRRETSRKRCYGNTCRDQRHCCNHTSESKTPASPRFEDDAEEMCDREGACAPKKRRQDGQISSEEMRGSECDPVVTAKTYSQRDSNDQKTPRKQIVLRGLRPKDEEREGNEPKTDRHRR